MLTTSPQQDSAAFAVAVDPDRTRVVVAPAGELDLATVPQVRRELFELRAAGFVER